MTVDAGRMRATIASELERHGGIVSAYLFGSFADARDISESDVDIGVLLDWCVYPTATERFDLRLRLIAALRAVLRREPDLVILNDAPPQLARHIIGGEPIAVVDTEANHAFRRMTLSRAADLEPFLRRMRRVKLCALAR